MIKKSHDTQDLSVERAVLVGLIIKGEQDEEQLQEYLDELAFLAETAGAETVKRFTQKVGHPDTKTFVGKGKLEEIRTFIKENEVGLVTVSYTHLTLPTNREV